MDTSAPPAAPFPAAADRLVVRELDRGEYNRVQEAGGPLAGYDLSQIEHMRITAVEQDGRIVAYWCASMLVHAEPLWIAPEARGRPIVVRKLLQGLIAILQDLGCQVAFGVIADADFDVNLPMARRMGFEKVPGDTYVIHVPQKGE